MRFARICALPLVLALCAPILARSQTELSKPTNPPSRAEGSWTADAIAGMIASRATIAHRWPEFSDPAPYVQAPVLTRFAGYTMLIHALSLSFPEHYPQVSVPHLEDLKKPLIEHEMRMSPEQPTRVDIESLRKLKAISGPSSVEASSKLALSIEMMASGYSRTNRNSYDLLEGLVRNLSDEERQIFKKRDDEHRLGYLLDPDLAAFKAHFEMETALAWDLIHRVLSSFSDKDLVEDPIQVISTLRHPSLLAKHIPKSWGISAESHFRIARLLARRIAKIAKEQVGALRIPHPKDQDILRNPWNFKLIEVPMWLALLRGFAGNDCSTDSCTYSPLHPDETVFFIEDTATGKLLGYAQVRKVVASGTDNEQPNSGATYFIHTVTGLGIQASQVRPILGAVILVLSEKGPGSQFLIPTDPAILNSLINRKRIQNVFADGFEGKEVTLAPTLESIWSVLSKIQPNSDEDPSVTQKGLLLSLEQTQNLRKRIEKTEEKKTFLRATEEEIGEGLKSQFMVAYSALPKSFANDVDESHWYIEFANALQHPMFKRYALGKTRRRRHAEIRDEGQGVVLRYLDVLSLHADELRVPNLVLQLEGLGLPKLQSKLIAGIFANMKRLQRRPKESRVLRNLSENIRDTKALLESSGNLAFAPIGDALAVILHGRAQELAQQISSNAGRSYSLANALIDLSPRIAETSMYTKPLEEWENGTSIEHRICRYIVDQKLATEVQPH